MFNMSQIGTDITLAKDFLLKSDVVAIPTETVYGLAGNAYNEDAILKIFDIKQRPKFDPLIVHTSSIERINEFVEKIPQWAYDLFEKFSPGPLTILLPKKSIIPDLATSGLPQVAVRIPNHGHTLELLESLPFPLAAPSANPFGYISPTTAQHVEAQLGAIISYILDGGSSGIGVESTIIGFENNSPIIYRLGGLSIEAIEQVTGRVEIRQSSSVPVAPGMLVSHYAPSKKFIIGDIEQLQNNSKNNVAILSFSKYYEGKNNLILSPKGDVNEAAKNLFSYLRILDNLQDVQLIVGEFVPDIGLGKAINDRLRRAITIDS